MREKYLLFLSFLDIILTMRIFKYNINTFSELMLCIRISSDIIVTDGRINKNFKVFSLFEEREEA